MFDTNDVYNDAVRGSSLHSDKDNSSEESSMGSKVVLVLLLTGIIYLGFSTYTANALDKALVVKNGLVAEIQIKSESLVTPKVNNSEENYLSALRAIEGELTEERENVNLDTSNQMSLSSAMNNLMDDNVLATNTSYTKELRKEIGIESDEAVDSRSVIVKKGDTLQGISNKFYGDAMNYKRIIASNDSLMFNDTIYEGQTIILPY